MVEQIIYSRNSSLLIQSCCCKRILNGY